MLLVFLAISLSQAHEFVYLKEVQKYYFDDKEMSEMQFTLDLYNVTILFISVSVLLSALYSVCYSILSNYSEISENVTKEIVRSSKFNMFGGGGPGSATEILNNNVKQVNVNIRPAGVRPAPPPHTVPPPHPTLKIFYNLFSTITNMFLVFYFDFKSFI